MDTARYHGGMPDSVPDDPATPDGPLDDRATPEVPPDDVVRKFPAPTAVMVLFGLAAATALTAFALFLRIPAATGERLGTLAALSVVTALDIVVFGLLARPRADPRKLRRVAIVVGAVCLVLQWVAVVAVSVALGALPDGPVMDALGVVLLVHIVAQVLHLIAFGLLTD